MVHVYPWQVIPKNGRTHTDIYLTGSSPKTYNLFGILTLTNNWVSKIKEPCQRNYLKLLGLSWELSALWKTWNWRFFWFWKYFLKEFKLEILRFWNFLGKPDTKVLNKILITTTEKATEVMDVRALHSNSHIRCQQSSEGVCYFPMVPLQAKWVFTLTW
jgi:hypothetical protein